MENIGDSAARLVNEVKGIQPADAKILQETALFKVWIVENVFCGK